MRVAGNCPMGCGKTLILGTYGHVTCSHLDCPHPAAANDLLQETEHEHVVEFTERGWTLQHPLRDRVEGTLLDCPATRACEALGNPPIQLGRYRMLAGIDGTWVWEKL